MSEKILVYIQEMKEKSRLENELAVAKLVQDSFFPPNKVKIQKLSLASFYTPATECGGDWWGHIEAEDKTIVIIADATGHGVPAAFLTATVHSCVQTLEQVSKTHPDILSTPEKILTFMNETVTRIGKDILLTGFVMIFDQKTGNLTYSNASHLDPLVLRVPHDRAATKQDLIPLMEGKGPRLGHEKTPSFKPGNFQLEKNDVFVLWTDGLTEAENPEGKQWGQRNFLKAFLSSETTEVTKIRENIINQLISFNKEHPFEDDVTLICGHWEGV
jgi:sigma-B regulation protein RsbU (phosphoserine phosphatase)